MTERQPPRWRNRARPREPRERSRTLAWLEARAHAETVQCCPQPRGCSAPARSTCRNADGAELVNLPAHDCRTKRAHAADPDGTAPDDPAAPAAGPAPERTDQ